MVVPVAVVGMIRPEHSGLLCIIVKTSAML